MRGEKYDVTYDDDDYSLVVWVPDAGIAFMRGHAYQPESFPPQNAHCVLRATVNVPYSVIKAARKYIQEEQDVRDSEKVLNMARNRLSARKRRCEERFQRYTEKLFVS